MNTYWITFEDGSAGTCDGESPEDAKRIASEKKGKEVKTVDRLPYPATPIIWQKEDPKYGPCPAFCYSPLSCKGRSCCPKRPSCVD